jgi:hypothetical protein
MRKFLSIGSALSIAVVTAVVALAAFSSGSSAAPGDGTSQARPRLPAASLVAITIGQVAEEDGETATVDLHASVRNGRAMGNLRFYSEEYGYYNGGVRTLKYEDGVITATGGGGLFLPDGTRVQVRYTATISVDDEHVEIAVKGKDGLAYTIEGSLEDGFIWAGDPQTVKTPAS